VSRDYANADCPHCHGEGFIYAASLLDGGRYCECTLDYQRRENMNRIWKGLKESKEIPHLREQPPLRKLTDRNLWITSQIPIFKAHLKAVGYTKSTLWDARVYSDKDILSAWLKTARAQGHKIYDSELDDDVGFAAMDIDELVEPPELVILILGVKHAPNKEAPNCLLEALAARRHIGRPTWIVDQPDQRLDDMAHRCYSEHLEDLLSHWNHVGLVGSAVKIMGGPIMAATAQPSAASDMDVEEILEPSEGEENIDNAIADLEENEEEGDGDEDEEEGNEDEEEGDEDDAPAGLLGSLTDNEEEQEVKSRKKRFSQKPKPWKGNKR